MDKYVIGSNTRLASVQEFGPNQALDSGVQVGARRQDSRAFATEFQGYGCKVLGRSLIHNAPDSGAAGKKDFVKTFFEQGGGFCHATQYHGEKLRVKILRHELCHVWQMRHRGPLMPLSYVVKGYWDNPYEREARWASR